DEDEDENEEDVSAKQILGLFKKALALGILLAAAQVGKLLELRALRRGELRWHLNINPHVQIAVPVALKVFDAFALEPEHGARLRAGGDFEQRFAVERGHFDFGSQRRLHEAHRHLAQKIVAVALEKFVGANVQDDVKITGR